MNKMKYLIPLTLLFHLFAFSRASLDTLVYLNTPSSYSSFIYCAMHVSYFIFMNCLNQYGLFLTDSFTSYPPTTLSSYTYPTYGHPVVSIHWSLATQDRDQITFVQEPNNFYRALTRPITSNGETKSKIMVEAPFTLDFDTDEVEIVDFYTFPTFSYVQYSNNSY